ncbi:ABC-three component system protein [Paraglaciecola chathamensis]|uniref:ABC-three component system protein n=1 Tax=Paraglaciecola chathamensis TaxID=368405 RepID=UPI00270B2710|nr:DUF2326 domain-containing protein [Paraglaciecola chathamensis]MDO6559054.1 DUF2326 domain-containing protein [Paraglaciecola chathamensis]
MIGKIYSDLATFKTVNLHSGLNLILADKAAGSDDGKTRNGAGKSSLVEIISTLLGGSLKKGDLLKTEEIELSNFGMTININGNPIEIQRTGSNPNKINVVSAPKSVLPVQSENGKSFITLNEWNEFLGNAYFGLDKHTINQKRAPTFRSLFQYFARPQKGFDSPEKTVAMQSTGAVQIALTYLFKLNWHIAREFEEVRQKEKFVKALKKAATEGALGDILGSTSELKTELTLKTSKAKSTRQALSEFRVLPEYQEKENRVSEISRELAEISTADITDKEWLLELKQVVKEESVPDTQKTFKLFQEAELDLPELVQRRFEEVAKFHESIVKNRREHLRQEIADIEERITGRLGRKKRLDSERAEIMSLLQSHGALDQYTKLQAMLSKLESEIELLGKKVEATTNLDDKTVEIKVERHNLQRKTRIDHSERDALISEAILSFADFSDQLYDESGRLTIDPTINGPKFEFDILGKKSMGKSKMQVFCFDMTLMKLWSTEPARPDILIHDSALFDGVDERQIAKALVIGARMAKEHNFQYIVTMNSDDLPDMSEFEDFDLDVHRVNLEITDEDTGGLFGFRF